jgi:trk system potassium uptake protein TrkH
VNPKVVLRHLGLLVMLLGVAMASVIPVALIYSDRRGLVGMAGGGALALLLGAAAYVPWRRLRANVGRRDAFLIVSLAWLLAGLVGGLPYLLSGALGSPADAFFESASGFTTTGSSVVPKPSALPRAIQFWRSMTQWLGGMGIIVLFVSVFAELGVGGRYLFNSEVPGPINESAKPRIKDTSAALWKIYFGMSFALAVGLLLSGMSVFDAVIHSFTTLSTGGFSSYDASFIGYPGVVAPILIIVFMVLAGANFSLYHQALLGRPGGLIRDREFLVYLGILAASTAVVAMEIWGRHPGGKPILHAAFQVVAIQTTTGFASDDFNQYPPLSKILLVVLMLVGGCAGSTAGGFKVARLYILAGVVYRSLYRLLRPRVVRPVRMGRQVVSEAAVEESAAYLFLFLVVFIFSTFWVAGRGYDMATSLSSVAATLGNIGPGLARVGAVENFAFFPADIKLLLAFDMLLGRLEIYTVFTLLLPVFWRR